MMKNYHHKRGFTLVESLVAVAILMIGVVGPLVIAARGITDGLFAQNQLAANYLAQEAMALLINLRDQNLALREGNWLQDIDNCLGQDCGVNGQSATIGVCSSATPCRLVYDAAPGQGFYRHPNVAESPFGPEFARILRLKMIEEDSDGPLEVEALVTLSWFNRLAPKEFTVVEHLYRNRAQGFNP